MGQVDDSALNLVYNLADFVNKIAFCLAIRASAKVNEHVKASYQTRRFIVTLGWSAILSGTALVIGWDSSMTAL